MMKMLSQVTAFISDLKLGFRSSKKGSYKSRSRREGESNDADDSQATQGCLGRSVSMEWGLASRRRRAKSTESLDRMSDHVRSAVSLMELTQATQARPVPGAGVGITSSTTSDTWSSSNSSSHASSNNRRTRQQRYHDDANGQPPGVGHRDQKRLQHLLGSTPNRQTNGRTNAPHQICLPPPPPRSAGSSQRRPNSLATPPTAFNSVPRQRPRRKTTEGPPTGRIPTLTPRRTEVDAVDGATVTPGSERTSNLALNRIADAQTNGAKLPLARKILPLTISSPVGSFPVSNGSGSRRVDSKTEAQSIPRGPDTSMQMGLLECVIDSMNGAAYYKGKLLGKGGFAKCYELNDIQSHRSYAGKIISKSRLTRDNQKDKIIREVELHRVLHHRNVVKFHSYFEDDSNVYIVLENCSRKSLVHILKHRKTLTEPEVRYYMNSLVNGLSYIHGQRVIHRDLKLGNMLLNETMELKIADFGLATKVEYEGEKKMTVCGTPNYIAPEVLQKKGHSYEADIWALGCIMYALLCGRPPFETNTLKETYMRIVANKFVLPPHVSMTARDLICRLLTLEPSMRPPLTAIQMQDFFADGHFPTVLSPSTCESRPKFPVSSIMPIRKPKAAVRNGSIQSENSSTSALAQSKGSKRSASQIITRNKTSDFEYTESKFPEDYPRQAGSAPSIPRDDLSAERINTFGPDSEGRLYRQLLQSIEATSQSNRMKPEDGANGFGHMVTSPSRFKTTVCVTKWVDYSNKYGFGFQLSNNSIGILFNDNTRMLLDPDGTTIELNDPNGGVDTFTQDSAPEEHQKKVTLLLYFAQYMDTHLISGGQLQTKTKYMPVFLKKWFRTDRAIVMFLTDGTLQVNFLEDHTKVIFNPDGAQDFLLTLVNSSRLATTYPLKSLRHFGCSAEVLDRLRYACSMLEQTINVEGVRV